MSNQEPRSGKRGGKVIPALCNILGMIILICVFGSGLAMTVPRLMGYETYNIVSASMEPEIPVGSIVYIREAEPSEIQEGDIIAFLDRDSSTVVHRVVQNRRVEGEFITKGDANETEDPEPVQYANFSGRVARHIPVIGGLMAIYASTAGKVYLAAAALCGVMLNMLGNRLRDRR